MQVNVHTCTNEIYGRTSPYFPESLTGSDLAGFDPAQNGSNGGPLTQIARNKAAKMDKIQDCCSLSFDHRKVRCYVPPNLHASQPALREPVVSAVPWHTPVPKSLHGLSMPQLPVLRACLQGALRGRTPQKTPRIEARSLKYKTNRRAIELKRRRRTEDMGYGTNERRETTDDIGLRTCDVAHGACHMAHGTLPHGKIVPSIIPFCSNT